MCASSVHPRISTEESVYETIHFTVSYQLSSPSDQSAFGPVSICQQYNRNQL